MHVLLDTPIVREDLTHIYVTGWRFEGIQPGGTLSMTIDYLYAFQVSAGPPAVYEYVDGGTYTATGGTLGAILSAFSDAIEIAIDDLPDVLIDYAGIVGSSEAD
jgi:hypothetical protein